MDAPQIISVAIFACALAVIISEKVHRAVVSLCGASLVLMLGVMPFDAALESIDYNTLGVLFGMMLFVGVVKMSGLFDFLAIACARLAKGRPWPIMALFILLTAVLSAFLDNVTTVLLVGSMTLYICKALDTDPVPFFMVEIMSSNIGGTATLIGDPPNIMIGSAAGFSFLDFILNDAPCVLIILGAIMVVFYFLYGRKLAVSPENAAKVSQMDARTYIKDARLLKISVALILLVVLGFMFHSVLGWESCVVALGAAALIMLLSRASVDEALAQVEWTTLAFFAGLFVMVGAMTYTGVIDALAAWLIGLTGGNVFVTMLVLLVGSAIVSSFLDNIPFVATMIPILVSMQATGMDVTPLWWAVSLGVCLGGNGTLIGASANVVLSDISRRNGHAITFAQYFKTGFPIMLLTILISAIYLVLRFPPA